MKLNKHLFQSGIISEQGYMNIITNMLCLGMYLGLLWYIDMDN